MDWSRIGEAVADILEIALILRLLSLRLHTVYKVFCLFLLVEVLTSCVALWIHFAHPAGVNYGIVWLGFAPVEWTLYLILVYTLLSALLAKFPGILSASRKFLYASFAAGAVIGLVTARPEFVVHERVVRYISPIGRLVAAGLVADRVISTVALLVLVATLAFILWFPVQMPRNLAVFSIGLVIYFAARTGLLIVYSFWREANANLVNVGTFVVLSACLLYWLIFINRAGEEAPARIGHSWGTEVQQQRVMAQLEAMNATLLRAARR